MKCSRGAANLARFNAARSAHVVPLLAHELQLCKKRRLSFKTVGLLAAYLSDRLKVHRTTLLRNSNYREMLLEHLRLQPGAVSGLPDTTLDPVVLQVKLASARLEASNLRQQVKQLTAQLAGVQILADSKSDLDFANLAMLLVNIIGRLEGTMEVDHDHRTVVDLSAKPSERLVAGPERAGAFISWLEQNQFVPAVRLLMKPARRRSDSFANG